MEPRDFYAALMDYGSHLKASGIRINNKSKHYTKQSKFEGSKRQKRAAMLRDALSRGVSEAELLKLLNA
jgi:A/G-specific adenine glycosylase